MIRFTVPLLTLVFATACDEHEVPPPAPEPAPEALDLDPVEEIDPTANMATAIIEEATLPLMASVEPVEAGVRMAARHILISYHDAPGATGRSLPTHADARAEAERLHAAIVAGSEDFIEVAKTRSSDGSASMGGMLGAFDSGVMHPAFERAILELEPGEIGGPVETPFGFHIIRREALLEYGFAHVLVQWDGGRYSMATRTKEEAAVRADEALAALLDGIPLGEVARTYSDGPSAMYDGSLGVLQRGQLAPPFDDVAFALKVGQTSPVVETPLGFHLIVRTQ